MFYMSRAAGLLKRGAEGCQVGAGCSNLLKCCRKSLLYITRYKPRIIPDLHVKLLIEFVYVFLSTKTKLHKKMS